MDEFDADGNKTRSSVWYHTKLRDGLYKFLDDCYELFEMHIVTFGSRLYATNIMERIDPDKKYFADRILSRDELLNKNNKNDNLESLFPCGTDFVIILDDRADVWMNSSLCLQVKPFFYFDNSGKPLIDNFSEKSSYLEKIYRVLRDIHEQFFEKNTDHKILYPTRDILNLKRGKIFNSLKFFLYQPNSDKYSQHMTSQIERLVENFGSSTVDIDRISEADHVIVILPREVDENDNLKSLESSDVLGSETKRSKSSYSVVSHNWILNCAYYFQQIDAQKFMIKDHSILSEIENLVDISSMKKNVENNSSENEEEDQITFNRASHMQQNSKEKDLTALMIDDLLQQISEGESDSHSEKENAAESDYSDEIFPIQDENVEKNSENEEYDELEKYVKDIEFNLSGDEDEQSNRSGSTIDEDEIPLE
ncbi:MAG: RNA polymerase II [Marteilia pararefringens]